VTPVLESRALPIYDRMLSQIDTDYMILTSQQCLCTDIVQVSMDGFRHVVRLPRIHEFAYQHMDRVLMGNEVYGIEGGQFKYKSTIYGEEITCVAGYDNRTIMCGTQIMKVGIYLWIEGQYQVIGQIRLQPQPQIDPVVFVQKLNDR
jgi:hypothetical protein